MSSGLDVDSIKFPTYSGWVSIKEGYLTSNKYWIVLCNGKLIRYKDWRQNFPELDHIVYVRRDYLTITELSRRWIKVGDISFQAENEEQYRQWLRYLRNVLDVSSDVAYSVEQCQNLIRRYTEQSQRHVGGSNYRDIILRLLGVLTISKDATTGRSELETLSHYLKRMGYAPLLCNLYSRVLQDENEKTITDEMLEQAANSDSVKDGQILLYILRRLIWRFSFASKMFALEVTRTEYVRQITNDARSLLSTNSENWTDGSYLLYSTLNCLQQFAKSPCKRDVFYKAGTFDFLIQLRAKEISNKVKMASLLTLSHVVKETDLHHLDVDEEFMKFFMSVCTKSVESNDHFTRICNRTPHLTEVREIFDGLCKLCRLEHIRKIVLQKNIAVHLRSITRGQDTTEIILALRLIEMISTSPGGRKLFQEEEDNAIIFRVMELQHSDDQEISLLAQKVFDLLRKREPKYVRELGTESTLLYLNAINEGSVRDRSIKVLIVGHASAGKTTLLKRLMADNIVGVESTEGIDIYAQKFVVDLKDGTWNIKIPDEHQDSPGSKMATAIQKWEKKSAGKQCPDTNKEHIPETNDRGQNDSIPSSTSKFAEELLNEETRVENYEENETCTVLYMREDISQDEAPGLNEKVAEIFEIESMLDLPEDFAFVTVYDFAGDEIYYATHHAYLSPYAVYIIVLDLSESNADLQSMKEKARFWFRSILTYGTFREDDGKLCCPPILFVGTHKDRVLVNQSEDTKLEFAKKHVDLVTEIPAVQGMNRDFIVDTFFVDNTDANDSTFQSVKKAIVKGAMRQSHWNENVPIKWIACEREIYLLQKKKEFLMSEQSLKSHFQEEGLDFPDEKEFFEMLRYLHHMGNIIYLCKGSESIRRKVLIHPHWLVNAFKHLVGFSHLDLPRNAPQKHLLHQRGLLRESYVLQQLENMSGSAEITSVLVAYMEELNLLAHIREEKAFLVSGLLEEQTLSVFLDQAFFSKHIFKTCALCFVFGDNFVADILFDKTIAACVSKWKVMQTNDNYLLGRRKGVFQLEGQWNLLLVGQNSALQLLLYKITDSSEGILCRLGFEVRLFIKETIDLILHTSSQNNIHPQEYIQCQILQSEKDTWVKVSDLFKYKKMSCCIGRSNGPHTLTSDHLRHWYPMIPDVMQGVQDTHIFRDLEEVFHTPPESPTPIRRFDISANCGDFDQHKFKKSYDATFTLDQLRSVVNYSDSIGQLVCPNFIGTCFRVGGNYLMTSFHLVKDIMKDRSPDLPIYNPAYLRTSVYIIFQQQHKFLLKPTLPFHDEELDVAILVLDLETSPSAALPPPLKLSVDKPSEGITFLLSGFGHPSHNKQVLEFSAMTLSTESQRVIDAKKWVALNAQQISNALLYYGKGYSVQDIERSYFPIDHCHHVAIDCFMEKGASGAPGIYFPTDKLNPEVSLMVSGGLPIFYWDLNECHMELIPPEIRMEYGVTMTAVGQKLLELGLINLHNEIFFPEEFTSYHSINNFT